MAAGSDGVMSLPPPAAAVNGCVVSTVVDSEEPPSLLKFDERSSVVVGCEGRQSAADGTVGVRSVSCGNDERVPSPLSSYGAQEAPATNGSARTDVGDTSNVPGVEADDLRGRSAKSGDNSTHISAADELSEDIAASADNMLSSSGCSGASSPDNNAVVQMDINTANVTLSEAEGISAADVSTDVRGRDSQATEHEPVVSGTECISSASLDTVSVPRCRHDRHSVSSISSDTTCASGASLLGGARRTDFDVPPMSRSSEKLWSWPNRRERVGFDSASVGIVRSSWSQENYFDDSDVTCVDIDFDDDDDDLASSVDALHYRDAPGVAGELRPHCWTEDDIRQADSFSTGKLRSWAPLKGDEVFVELFDSSCSDSDHSSARTQPVISDCGRKAAKTYGVGVAIDFDPSEDSSNSATSLSSGTDSHRLTNWIGPESSTTDSSSNDNFDDLPDDVVSFPPSVFSDIATRPASKDVDRPSAARLAKRLYYLQGFRKSDISRHLTKKYDVSCTTSCPDKKDLQSSVNNFNNFKCILLFLAPIILLICFTKSMYNLLSEFTYDGIL